MAQAEIDLRSPQDIETLTDLALSQIKRPSFLRSVVSKVPIARDLYLAGSIALSGIGPPPSPPPEPSYFFPSAISASHSSESQHYGYQDRFTLDLSPQQSAEQIPESEVDNYQPENIRAFIAYPWMKNKEIDGTWSYWKDNKSHPPYSWVNNILPIFKINQDGSITPEKQLYSSNDPKYAQWLLSWTAYSNLNTIFLSNWGPGTKSDLATQRIFEYANSDENPYRLIRLAAYFDFTNLPPYPEIVKFIKHYKWYAENNPKALRDPKDRKLIIAAYGRDEDDYTKIKRLNKAARKTGVHILTRPYPKLPLEQFLMGDDFPEPYGWSPYAPANAVVEVEQDGKKYKQISARFDSVFESRPRLPEDPLRFEMQVQEELRNPSKVVSFIFDEVGEGGLLAPGLDVTFRRRNLPFINWDKSYGYLYVNILHRNFPPLPQIISGDLAAA